MRNLTTDVLVIGGGATGAGVLRDLALRGIRAALVEKGDLTHGTTGRYHGLLHSGGRYVIKDPQSATECAHENEILRRIMPHCLEDTGGFFVTTPADDPAYADRFAEACRRTHVPVEEIAVREALAKEPLLNRRISRAFAVRDAAADSFAATHANADDARANRAMVLTYHAVTALLRTGDVIVGAVCEDLRTGETVQIDCGFIINAAGAWAGKVAALAGVVVTVVPGKGTMIAMNHRIVNTVINRCKLPHDGDIIVPIQTVAVLGTSDMAVPDPDVYGITEAEVQMILAECEQLVPGVSKMRALRAWAGVRPLYKDNDTVDDRDISRTYKLLDHRSRDGVDGMVSIVGGKWTTYRLMAQEAVDAVAARLGNTIPCRTDRETLAPPGTPLFTLGQRLKQVEDDDTYGELICECELVTRRQIDTAIDAGAANLDDLRRDTRLGMGPCQGGFCAYRAAAIWQERAAAGQNPGPSLLKHFIQERWKGLTATTWGDQLRQARLDELIAIETLGIDLLPDQPHDPTTVTDHPAIATEYHAD